MRYPAACKEAILRKMAPPMSMTIPELAEQEGVSEATPYNWQKQTRARGQVLPSRSTQSGQWTSQEKFQIVLGTAPMNEAELSAYCRERGLYPEQVEAWRDACMNANDEAAAQAGARTAPQGQSIGRDSGFADAIKKAEAIWGTPHNEDD